MKKYLFLIAMSAMTLCACQNQESDINENKGGEFTPLAFEKSSTTELSSIQKSMMDAQAEFNCEFFKAVVAQSQEANLVVSPVSMSMDLAMVANGACGETLTEIHRVLGSETASQDDFNALNNLLYTALPAIDPKATISLANSIWVNKDMRLKESFMNVCSQKYDASVKAIDMYSSDAMVEINRWAENKTNGLIKNFLQEPPKVEVSLLNALYFKAPWLSAFDAKNTAKADFYGKEYTSKIDFMENEEMNCYISGSSIGGVISFPFGNGTYSFTIVQPYDDISKAIKDLTPQTIKQICAVSTDSEHLLKEWVKIPKFKLDYKNSDLLEAIKTMGLTNLADFSAMSYTELMIGKITQAVNFSIDENGGEGAAVSDIGMESGLPGDYTPQPYTVNRPFIFFVSEKSTGAILFMGKVTQL